MERANERPAIRHDSLTHSPVIDKIAIEEPLNTSSNRPDRTLYGSLMRTPGNDLELIIGMLISSGDLMIDENIPEIDIQENCAHVSINSTNSNRIIDGTSACGLCGREEVKIQPLSDCDSMPDYTIESEIIHKIISNIGENQNLFELTGGTHAAASWNKEGIMTSIMEDVGRHNALDKLIGLHRMKNDWPLSEYIITLSGRISYEMVEKAVRSKVGILISVGSATTAAIDLATFHNLTLIVFARDQRFTCMTGGHRIIIADAVK